MREKCPYSEVFWFPFFRIQTAYGEILLISPYSVQMRENTYQKIAEYGHFSHNVTFSDIWQSPKNLNVGFLNLFIGQSVTPVENGVNFNFMISHSQIRIGRCNNCTHCCPFYLQIEFEIKC